MPTGTRKLPKASAGIDLREVTKCRRGEAAQDPAYAGYGFADVRRACHRWLMKRDERYRRDYLARTEASASPTSTFAPF